MAKITEYTFYNFLVGLEKIVFPIYQMKYDWQEKNCEKLFNDIVNFSHKLLDNIESDDQIYFLGTITSQKKLSKNNNEVINYIVDGQQRITTFSLMCIAISNLGYEVPYNFKNCIWHGTNERDLRIRISGLIDSDVFKKISENKAFAIMQEQRQSNLYKNYMYFFNTIKKFKEKSVDDAIWKQFIRSLNQITIVNNTLWTKENPTEWFETINTTAVALTQTDLIKNKIFYYSYNMDEAFVDRMASIWDNEIIFYKAPSQSKKASINDFDQFFRHWISIFFNANLPNKDNVYNEFRNEMDGHGYKLDTEEKLEDFLKKLSWHSQIYKKVLDIGKIKNYKTNFFNIVFNDAFDTYYVLVHNILDYIAKTFYSSEDNPIEFLSSNVTTNVLSIITQFDLNWFLMNKDRKTITRSTPKLLSIFINDNKEAQYVNVDDFLLKFKNWLMERDSSIKLYSYNDTIEVIKNYNNDHYLKNKKITKNILLGAELGATSGDTSNIIERIKKTTLEHIMPQSWEHTAWEDNFMKEYGTIERAREFHNTTVHNIGNLALVIGTLNSSLSNKSFNEKIVQIKSNSALATNNCLADVGNNWNKQNILDRASYLIKNINKLYF